MSNARLLHLFLLLICAPAAGLPFLLGFTGSTLIGLGAAATIVAMIAALSSSIALPGAIRTDILLLCLAIAFALCLLGGEGRVFFANTDWLVRDAVLHDLVSQPWPFAYRLDGDNAAAQSFIVRAPLAIYMLPAAAGKAFGLHAAHLALLLQDTLLFALILYFVVPTQFDIWRAAAVVAIFAVFSGLDVVPVLAKHAMHLSDPPSPGVPADHLENWAGLFQYSSNITQIFWAPPHAIAGWAVAGLYLLWQRGQVRASVLLCALPYIAFWSPFAVIGALPFAGYAAVADLIARRINRADIVAALLAAPPALLVLAYLIQGDGGVEHGFLLGAPHFWNLYIAFIYIEIAPYLVLIVAMRPTMLKEPTFLLIVASLLLIPFYKLGQSNDFAMRVSIPALTLLAANFAITLTESIASGSRLVWARVATLTLLIGGATGAVEIRRALITPAAPISDCGLMQAWGQSPYATFPKAAYVVNLAALPAWMRPQAPADAPATTTAQCFAQ
jgi:hypothetical protein